MIQMSPKEILCHLDLEEKILNLMIMEKDLGRLHKEGQIMLLGQ